MELSKVKRARTELIPDPATSAKGPWEKWAAEMVVLLS